ncbi:unnamed protein product [Leptosia nina]|uniref:Uncharacterized protein n=1 Tax=Leptosia nina TaxID=320188 RepID=A0AAV1JJF8_9NEOP
MSGKLQSVLIVAVLFACMVQVINAHASQGGPAGGTAGRGPTRKARSAGFDILPTASILNNNDKNRLLDSNGDSLINADPIPDFRHKREILPTAVF